MQKNLRTLLLLFTSNTISGAAQGITLLSIPFFLVSQIDNGKLLNARLVTIITLVTLFWSLYAGTLIDRYNKKHIILSYQGVDALILLGIGAYGMFVEPLGFPLVAAVYTITVMTLNVHYPNLYAFVQELFEPRYYAKVNSMLEVQNQFSRAIGMFVGGILLEGSPEWLESAGITIEKWSMGEIFFLDGCTYALGMIAIGLIRYTPNLSKNARDLGSVLKRLQLGFEYLSQHRPLLIFGVASYVMFFAALITLQILMPVYVNDYLDESGHVLAMFNSVYALGALVIGLVVFLAKRLNPLKQIIFLLFLGGLLYATWAVTKSVSMVVIGAFVMGITNAGIRILRITFLVQTVPNRVIGRTNSFFNVSNVLFRVSLSSMLTLSFFSDPENGDNIIYASAIIAALLCVAGIVLLSQRKNILADQEAIHE
ncbi:MAG: MFS transporter [Bacteroidota bacterium]